MGNRCNILGPLALLVCLTAGSAAAHDIDRTPAPDLKTLQARVADVLEQHQVPGAGLALFSREKLIWAGGIGQADVGQAQPVTADTRFRVGSVTKSLVAAAVLDLAAQGRLDLQARIKDVAPEVDIQNSWHNTDPVRVVHLLEHTAGFDDMHFKDAYNLGNDPAMPLLGAVNHGYEALRVRWRPGSRRSYANPGYGVAGVVLEKITGRPYEEYLEQQLFSPLGMRHSTLRFNGGRLEGLAAGYTEPDGVPVTHRAIYLRPAGNLVTTPADLARFGRMLLGGGVLDGRRVLPAEAVQRMQRVESTPAAAAGLQSGYAAGLNTEIIDSLVLYGHSGSIDGYLSYFGFSPGHDFGFVVLLNASHSGEALREICRLLVAYQARDAVAQFPAVANVPDATLADYAGYYRAANPRNEIMHFVTWLLDIVEVRARDGKLEVRSLLGHEQTLVPVSATLFRTEDAPVATSVFLRNGGGEPVLVSGDAYRERASWFSTHVPLYLLLTALGLMASVLVFTLVWLVRLLLGRLREVKYWSVRILPPLAVVFLLAGAASLAGVELADLAVANVHTVGYAVFSVLFVLTSLAALVQSVRAFFQPVHAGVRIYSLLVSLSCVWVSVWLLYWGVIGVRLWSA